ncbi:hypothetical protein [Polyangium mundeleinium]|uniref:Uncharacterized protein n=1 Tax=Polyangium mundeleinium TaxID=2995306 RepID=A0ABT5EIU7_9BACT|nr:hypothetical protein [Polyangium mundeleinium]MDC0741696.1 hypothetical protein [Polyangium mundeleinium]
MKKWDLAEMGDRSGGRLSPSGVVYNHRFLAGDAGVLAIERSRSQGTARLVGTTLVAVKADDDATKKELYDILGGS